MTERDVSFKSLMAELVGDVGDLLRHELRLAQAEVAEKISRLQVGIVTIVLGLICALCAMLILLQALVLELANSVPPWLAAIIVGVATGLAGVLLVYHGLESIRSMRLTPERTMRAVRQDKEMIMEEIR